MKRWFERQRYFMDFAIASLARGKVKNTSLVLCYALVVFLIASVLFFSASIRHEAVSVLENSPEILVQKVMAGRYAPIPLEYAEKIGEIPGVRRVVGRLWGYYFHPAAGANYTVMVPTEEEIADDTAQVGLGVVRTWRVADGGMIRFKAYDGTAVALAVKQAFGAETELFTSDLILISETTFGKIFGIPEAMATDLAVTVRNPREWRSVAEKIVRVAPDVRAITREEIQRTYASIFDWRSGYVLVLWAGAVLAFLIFAADRASGMGAREKNEIAILKAVGWETSDVLSLKFWEGLIVSSSAYLIGVIAAYFHVFFFPAPLFEHALKGWSVLYPKFAAAPVFDLYDLAAVFALAVVPYSFISIVPAWKAAIADPDAVTRFS